MDLPLEDSKLRVSVPSISDHYSVSTGHLPEEDDDAAVVTCATSQQHISSSGGDTAMPTHKRMTAGTKHDDGKSTLGISVIGENIIISGRPLLMPAGEDTGESQSLQPQVMDDDEMSALSQETGFLTLLFPRSKKGQWCCLVFILLVVIGSITVAVVCATGLCRCCTANCSSNNNATNTENTNNNMTTTKSPSSTMTTPTHAPTTTLPTSLAPTAMPTPKPQAFLTTQELYEAVDAYLNTGTANPVYGHSIRAWDVSQLTNFSSVFDARRNPNASKFNEDLTGWDTAKAVTMENMFYDARSFDGNISTWQTGGVTNMREALSRATNFSGNLSQWDVSSVITMDGMCKCQNAYNSGRIERSSISPSWQPLS
jgi:surface protein